MKHFDCWKAPTSRRSKSMTSTRSAFLRSNHPRTSIGSSLFTSSFSHNLKVIQTVASRTPTSNCCASRFQFTGEQFYKIFPGRDHSIITVVNPKTHAWHCVHLKEAATWILNAVQWFNIVDVEQPMMIAIWTRDWQDAAKSQYLLQNLQVNFQDYIPKWQIILQQDDDMPKRPLGWRYPATIWDGQPVIGFMAETNFEDAQGKPLAAVSFADFNPTCSFPNTSVKSNYENISFGMDAPHLRKDPPHAKDALIAQCPMVVFKASTDLQSLGIIARRIFYHLLILQ